MKHDKEAFMRICAEVLHKLYKDYMRKTGDDSPVIPLLGSVICAELTSRLYDGNPVEDNLIDQIMGDINDTQH